MKPFCVATLFHPVGQGLFCSGHLFDQECQRKFSWIFDCGTLYSQRPIEIEIARLESLMEGDKIDAFCISHFDKDHVSGAKTLLTEVGARVLFLPYLALTERAQLIIDENADDWYAEFLIDPAAYLLTIGGEGTRVVYVAGGPDGPEAPTDDIDPNRDPRGEDRDEEPLWEPSFTKGTLVSEADAPQLYANGESHLAEVITHDQIIGLGTIWEFVFYNEHRPEQPIPKLQAAVLDILTRNRNPDSTFDGPTLLQELRKEYQDCFGYGGRAANRISLVMYSGPLRGRPVGDRARWHLFELRCYWQLFRRLFTPAPNFEIFDMGRLISGVLMTGDIYFDNEFKIRSAEAHFSARRWRRIDVLQVPHHGSSYSWYKGASNLLHNRVSVVSSASGNPKHPGPMVVSDLACHGLTRVTEQCGLIILGWL